MLRGLKGRARLVLAGLVLFGMAWSAVRSNAAPPPERYLSWTRLAFPAADYRERRERVRAEVARSGGGVLIVPSRPGLSDGFTFRQLDDFLYLTGLEFPDSFLVLDSEAGVAEVFAPGTDPRFTNPGRANDFPGRALASDPAIAAGAGITISPLPALPGVLQALARASRHVRIVAPASALSALRALLPPFDPNLDLSERLRREYPSLSISSAAESVARVRSIKSAAEITRLREAAEIGVRGIAHAASFVKAGVSERALEGELEAFYKRRGAERLPFASIIKSGTNSLWPWRILASHSDRRNRQMQNGELVIFDVGCEKNSYVSDVGRTFPVSGRFSPRQRELLEMEVGVADAIIAKMKPGALLRDITAEASALIPERERTYMQTGSIFGHHLGLSTGDPFLLDEPLKASMVITVEPWYYNHDEGVAVFTEDVILVTPNGSENLSAMVPRRPADLERLMRKH